MNLYATLTSVKADLRISATTHDAVLLRYLEGASRAIDLYCHRGFYVQQAVRYQTARMDGDVRVILLDADLLSLSAMTADSQQDGTYDGETWVEGTHFYLAPYNAFPKLRVEQTPFGTYGFVLTPRTYKLTGQWGYGDKRSATPYTTAAANVTAADATTLTATVNAIGNIQPGHTLLVGTEQMYVSAVSALNLTVVRGMNGTTAAAHTAVAASIYRYPADVVQFASWLAQCEFKDRGKGAMQQEKIGDYFYTRMTNDIDKRMLRCLGGFVRDW